MSPEITSAVTMAIAGLVVGIITYFTSKINAHKGAKKVRDVVEKQFEERIGQPNGLGPVISMLSHMMRSEEATREKLDTHVRQDEQIVTEIRKLLDGRTERFDRLDAAIGAVRERQDLEPEQ